MDKDWTKQGGQDYKQYLIHHRRMWDLENRASSRPVVDQDETPTVETYPAPDRDSAK